MVCYCCFSLCVCVMFFSFNEIGFRPRQLKCWHRLPPLNLLGISISVMDSYDFELGYIALNIGNKTNSHRKEYQILYYSSKYRTFSECHHVIRFTAGRARSQRINGDNTEAVDGVGQQSDDLRTCRIGQCHKSVLNIPFAFFTDSARHLKKKSKNRLAHPLDTLQENRTNSLRDWHVFQRMGAIQDGGRRMLVKEKEERKIGDFVQVNKWSRYSFI